MWARAKSNLDDVPDAVFVDRGPTHDLWIRTDFRLRIKRHGLTGAIRAYPTPATLDFISQQADLFGIATVNLTVGYEWDEHTQAMGAPVISLRNGSFDDPIWVVGLPSSAGESATVARVSPTSPAPATPTIGLRGDETSEGAETS